MERPDQTCGYCAYQLEQFFHGSIPLYRKLGGRVMSYDGKRLVMEAPLEGNAVSCGYVFAGAINSLFMLCGFGLIRLKLNELGFEARVMLGSCSISCEDAVRTDFRAYCELKSSLALDRIKQTLQRNDRAYIRVVGGTESGTDSKISFNGLYAARLLR